MDSTNPEEEKFSPSQQYAIDYALTGGNFFLTGGGGTGKSFVTNTIVQKLREKGHIVQVTSTTGVSAIHINAVTIHSFSGIGIGNYTHSEIETRAKDKRIMSMWRDIDVLIIDEISMLKCDYFEKLELIARCCRGSRDIFGGLQIIAVGDFYQLPPVVNDHENHANVKRFCFESPLWFKVFPKTIELTTVFRQADNVFSSLLERVREGKTTESDFQVLKSRVRARFPNDGIFPTKLYANRKNVNVENDSALSKLNGREFVYKAIISGPCRIIKDVYTQFASQSISKQIVTKFHNIIEKICPIEKTIKLKIGAQVILACNLDTPNGLVNGSRGVVMGFDQTPPHNPVVKFVNGKMLLVPFYSWKVRINKENYMSLCHVPLSLAYAYTIHKSQSQTLDRVLADLGKGIFEPGQAYVALSRVKSLDGLSLLSIEKTSLRCNNTVKQFYDYIRKQNQTETKTEQKTEIETNNDTSDTQRRTFNRLKRKRIEDDDDDDVDVDVNDKTDKDIDDKNNTIFS